MKKWLNRRSVLFSLAAIIVLPVLTCVAWLESAPVRGRWAARSDLAHGHYRVLAYGLPPAGVNEYRKVLQDRYGVEYRQVALCIVSPGVVNYVDAYDSVSGAAIQRKFGQDIFKKSWDEANRRFQENHKAELQDVSRSE